MKKREHDRKKVERLKSQWRNWSPRKLMDYRDRYGTVLNGFARRAINELLREKAMDELQRVL